MLRLMGLPRPTRGLAMTRCYSVIPRAGLHLLAVALRVSLSLLFLNSKPYCHSEERLCLDVGISNVQLNYFKFLY